MKYLAPGIIAYTSAYRMNGQLRCFRSIILQLGRNVSFLFFFSIIFRDLVRGAKHLAEYQVFVRIPVHRYSNGSFDFRHFRNFAPAKCEFQIQTLKCEKVYREKLCVTPFGKYRSETLKSLNSDHLDLCRQS